MSTNVSLNGTTYAIPAVGEANWGSAVTSYLVALGSGVLQKAGGAFTLTAEADFGATYGLKAAYFKSRGTVASAGQVRLGSGESIKWRNAANTDDVALATATDWLQFAGVDLVSISRTQTLTNKTIVAASNTITTAATGNLAATELNAALAELQTDVDTRALDSDLDTHTADTSVHGVTGDVVGTSDSQTLTNKTLTSPAIGTAATFNAQAEARFGDSDTSNYVGFKAPATVGANCIFTLPDADGTAGQLLKTDGSKVLGWASALTDPMSAAGDIIIRNGGNATDRLAVGTEGKALRVGSSLPAWAWQETTSAKSADYTVTDTDGITTVLMTTGATDRTVTLPTAADNSGRKLVIKKVDSGTGVVTVDGEGAETIDGAASVCLQSQYDSVTLICDGTGWHVQDFSAQVVSDLTASGSALTLTNNTTADIASIELEPGKYIINAICCLAGSLTGTRFRCFVGTTSGNNVTGFEPGENGADSPTMPNSNSDTFITIAGYPVTVTSTTTYYLKSRVGFSAGTATSWGRISAHKVAMA